MLLLDASVWVAAGAPVDRYHAASAALVRDTDCPVGALDLTLYEVANAMGVKHRQPEEARKLHLLIQRSCGDRLLRVDVDLLTSAVEVAAEHGLTAYDAAYVAAAEAHGWTLVSTDLADLVSKGLAVTPDAADYP
ncbi:MAG: PIN domain-containing protein [Solirubrobacterales bacterium]